jgi:hypothetical protein
MLADEARTRSKPAEARVDAAAPVVLLASTTSWPFPARIAMAFAEIGWAVEAICWYGNPMAQTRCVRRRHHYAALRPMAALSGAIARAAPDLIVPCDDRALAHLLALHADLCRAGRHADAATIARSLGAPQDSLPARFRAGFIDLARREGVRAPPMLPVADLAALREAVARLGLPVILKMDNTWGGEGVAKAATLAEAERAFVRMARGKRNGVRLRRAIANADPFQLLPGPRAAPAGVNVQRFIPGRPANCLVSCWQGEVLALIEVDVLSAQHAMGPATIVRLTDDAEIAEAARRVVARLRLSGFCGLDFVIDDATGEAHLIEMNQRVTPLGHLALGAGRDPVAALAARHNPTAAAARAAVTSCDTVAFYPDAWRSDPDSPFLPTAYHDIPRTEPDLMRILARVPWKRRSRLLGFLRRRLTGSAGPATWSLPAWWPARHDQRDAMQAALSGSTVPTQ